MRVAMKPGTTIVEDCTLAFGGMAPTTVLALRTMAKLKGRWVRDCQRPGYLTTREGAGIY